MHQSKSPVRKLKQEVILVLPGGNHAHLNTVEHVPLTDLATEFRRELLIVTCMPWFGEREQLTHLTLTVQLTCPAASGGNSQETDHAAVR